MILGGWREIEREIDRENKIKLRERRTEWRRERHIILGRSTKKQARHTCGRKVSD